MQPCSREMQAMDSLLNTTQQLPLQNLQINGLHTQFDNPTSSLDDFLEQMLSTTSFPLSSSSWSEVKSPGPCNLEDNAFHHDENEILASKLSQQQQHQINGGDDINPFQAMKMMMMMQQQMMVAGGVPTVASGGTRQGGGEGSNSMQALFNGYGDGSFNHPQVNFGANSKTDINQSLAPTATAPPEKPKQKVRARRGQATDPHSIAERLRRVRIAENMKALQELVPNANKTDKASMLDEIIDYVKFLQLQVKVLSMSRLGGAASVAPLVTDMPSEAGGDCIQTSANGGGSLPRNSNGDQTSSANDSLTVTEHQVAKLMEEDMGSAMQYLQGKGLCLMPISLATAISTATSHSRNPMINHVNPNNGGNGSHLLLQSSGGGDGPSSPSMSVLTVQSATMGNGGVDGAASVSKP